MNNNMYSLKQENVGHKTINIVTTNNVGSSQPQFKATLKKSCKP